MARTQVAQDIVPSHLQDVVQPIRQSKKTCRLQATGLKASDKPSSEAKSPALSPLITPRRHAGQGCCVITGNNHERSSFLAIFRFHVLLVPPPKFKLCLSLWQAVKVFQTLPSHLKTQSHAESVSQAAPEGRALHH